MRMMQHIAKGFALAALTAIFMLPVSVAAEDDGMLYLVEFEATEAGAPTTRDQAIELLENVIVPSLGSLAGDDRVLAGGLYAGARAGAFVIRAKSHDEATDLVRALPAWGVWAWKVRPLESFAHRAEVETRVIEGLRAQE